MGEYVADEELVQCWLEALGEPTKEEVLEEIEDVKENISNNEVWLLGCTDEDDYEDFSQNLADLKAYKEALEEMLG